MLTVPKHRTMLWEMEGPRPPRIRTARWVALVLLAVLFVGLVIVGFAAVLFAAFVHPDFVD